jgi:hypothetical protein
MGDKTARAWRWPPTTSSLEVQKRVQLYLYSPSGPLWPVLVVLTTCVYVEISYFHVHTQVAALFLKGLKMKVGNINCFAVITRRIRIVVEGEKYAVQEEIPN